VPLHTLRADIDYATRVAPTTYGVLGVSRSGCSRGECLPGRRSNCPPLEHTSFRGTASQELKNRYQQRVIQSLNHS